MIDTPSNWEILWHQHPPSEMAVNHARASSDEHIEHRTATCLCGEVRAFIQVSWFAVKFQISCGTSGRSNRHFDVKFQPKLFWFWLLRPNVAKIWLNFLPKDCLSDWNGLFWQKHYFASFGGFFYTLFVGLSFGSWSTLMWHILQHCPTHLQHWLC